jgi:hypothetical protein
MKSRDVRDFNLLAAGQHFLCLNVPTLLRSRRATRFGLGTQAKNKSDTAQHFFV